MPIIGPEVLRRQAGKITVLHQAIPVQARIKQMIRQLETKMMKTVALLAAACAGLLATTAATAQDAAAGIAVAGVRGWEQPVQPVPEPFPEPDRNTSRARRGHDEETGQA